MKVLSLFDGISVGQLSLKELNINISKYYASEVDPYAISVTRFNFPDTIFLGDVREIEEKDLPYVDLLIGGSPCQNFSFAGKQKGMRTKENIIIESLDHYLELKEKDFEFEGQSYLFWEYVRILSILKKKNPKIKFLLENVKMSKRWKNLITFTMKNEPILINSRLVSAQNRDRLYWTNIIRQDGINNFDKRIKIKDVINKNITMVESLKKIRNVKNISDCENKYVCAAIRGRYIDETKTKTEQMLELRVDEKTNTVTTVQKDNVLIFINKGNILYRNFEIVELERLQTLPDNYTKQMENKETPKTKRIKMIGNSWTKEIIKRFFIHLSF